MPKNKKLKILKKARKVKMYLKNADCENIYSDLSLCKVQTLFNREVIIEGCKKVCEYSQEQIIFKVSKGSVTVYGENLNIYSFENEIAIIRGKIISLGFGA